MFKLLKYLKGYIKESVLGPLFKLLEVCFELTVPLIIARIIDYGIGAGDKPYILRMCGILAVLAVVGLASAVTAQYFAAKAAAGFATVIRKKLFGHIGKLSYSQLDSIGASTLITRLTGDINQVQSGVNMTLRLLLRSPFVVFGAVIMAFTVDVRSALIFVIVIPLLSAVIFGIMLASIPLYKRVQLKLDGVLLKTRENLQGTRVIRAFCKEEAEISDFNSANGELTKMQIIVGRIASFLNPATFIIINTGIVVLIYTGALDVQAGGISKGDVVALYNYMSQILVELIKLASLIISVNKSIACGNRIQAVLDMEPAVVSGAGAYGSGGYAVEFESAGFSYGETSEKALNGISLKIRKGETVGIIGSTGSGKTSLVNLIPRFYDVTEGRVRVCGSDVRDYDLKALRGKIGIVPQKTSLFSGTLRENIKIGKADASDSEIIKALYTAQAGQLLTDKPEGLDLVIEQDGRNLSGGQKQRVAIARALVRKPEILILDDSSSALDYATSAALSAALRETDFSPTVIIVSQRVAAIHSADRIVVLDEGEIAGIGTEIELLESCEVYREIYKSQVKMEGESA